MDIEEKDDEYDLYGLKAKVGDIIVPTDGTDYVGEIIFISKAQDTVKHKCIKPSTYIIKGFKHYTTGTIFSKSYTGFGIRYKLKDKNE